MPQTPDSNRIWMHRISHEEAVSSVLLQQGYLSIGWAYLLPVHPPEDMASEAFGRFVDEQTGWDRRRGGLKRFGQMKPGDWVVVPLWKEISIFEVTAPARPVSRLPLPAGCKDSNGQPITQKPDGLLYRGEQRLDIGFVLPVQPVQLHISKEEYVDRALTSTLKFIGTNHEITTLRPSVEKALEHARKQQPIRIYDHILEQALSVVLNHLHTDLNPDKLERLVRWYMEHIGADYAFIPPKRPKDKQGGEDADVVARFDRLKSIIYVQAKYHQGITSEQAVQQVWQYRDLHAVEGYTTAAWVISTADDFSDKAKELAEEKQVLLIDGKEWARMLLDAGFHTLDEESL